MRFDAKQALCALALAAAGVAQAEVVPLEFDARGRFERELSVAPGKFVEVCGALPAGASVQWRYEAQAPLDFNIHYHVGQDVRYPTKLAASALGTGVLKTDSAQDYCWMWIYKGKAATTLKLMLARAD